MSKNEFYKITGYKSFDKTCIPPRDSVIVRPHTRSMPKSLEKDYGKQSGSKPSASDRKTGQGRD
jgi:hypothetical protein